MNRRQLLLATSIVATLLAIGAAFAQSDSLLQRYDLAVENLDIAVNSVPSDGAQARDELERALNALLTLSASSSSPNLVSAMEKTFERTRVAIENQSRTDMAVQTAVLRGGFARLVMDAAFIAAAEGELDLAKTRLQHLAMKLSFTAEAQDDLAEASSTDELRLAFEAGSAEAVATDLQVAERLLDSDRPAAYENLARAYGESLLVQDSPRSDGGLNTQLVAAATALVAEDDASVREAVSSAELQLSRLASSARGGAVAEAPAATAEPQVEPAELSGEAGDEAPPVLPAADETVAPATATVDAATEAVVEESTAGTPQDGAAQPDATAAEAPATGAPLANDLATQLALGDETPADATPADPASLDGRPAADALALLPLLDSAEFDAAVQQRLNKLEAERRQEELDNLTRQLTVAGLPAAQADASATRLISAGHSSLDSALTTLDAGAGRAVAAQRSGDASGASAALTALNTDYQELVAPLLRSVNADVADNTENLLASSTDRPNLTLGEVTLVAAQMSAVRASLEGRTTGLGHDVELVVDSVWSNWVRVSVMILLGLLAIVPLVLLNLAFGGGNRNWRLIGTALFLLLVPVFYEALISLAALVAAFVDWPWLATVGAWSMFNSVTGYVVWALLVLIALLLATAGFYGICVQFGLLGGSRGSAVATTGTAVEVKRPSGHTTIDWDEEF